MRGQDGCVPVSVIREAVSPKCNISTLVSNFLLQDKRKNEKKPEIAVQKKASPAARSSSEGRSFHKGYSNFMRKDLKPYDAISSVLHRMKRESLDFAISSDIVSEACKMMGAPDFIFYNFSSVKTVELKKRPFPSKYELFDRIQVESYMLILGDESLETVPHMLKADLKNKDIEGYLLYGNGSLIRVEPKNSELIRLKASETLEMIDKYKSISELPKPSRCNPNCSNVDFCIGNNVIQYENIFAGSGRAKIESPAYGARA